MRLEARIKMGYYPTPISVVKRIKSFIQFPKEKVMIFDPCCGEGSALREFVQGENAITYGIELDNHRAEQAKKNINHVLKGSYEDSRITNNSFSCLFLNPPYDFETNEEDGESINKRKEKTFLKNTIKYLKTKGLLVYIIPKARLDKTISKILSYRFENFKVYRFQDDEYEPFKQIVLFAIKKEKNSLDEKSFIKLSKIPDINLEEIPFSDKPIYPLPFSVEIPLFKSSILDVNELEKELKDSPLWKRFREITRIDTRKMERPPLPLHTGHLGLLLANGCLDGIISNGDDRHIVRGKVEKVTTNYKEYKGEIIEERELESYRVSIKILKINGEIITLM